MVQQFSLGGGRTVTLNFDSTPTTTRPTIAPYTPQPYSPVVETVTLEQGLNGADGQYRLALGPAVYRSHPPCRRSAATSSFAISNSRT